MALCERCGDKQPLEEMHVWQAPPLVAWLTERGEYDVCFPCLSLLAAIPAGEDPEPEPGRCHRGHVVAESWCMACTTIATTEKR